MIMEENDELSSKQIVSKLQEALKHFIATNEVLENYANGNNFIELLSDLDPFDAALLENGEFEIQFLTKWHVLKIIDGTNCY